MLHIKNIDYFVLKNHKIKFNRKKIAIFVLLAVFVIGLFGFGSILNVRAQNASESNFGLTYGEDIGEGNQDVRLTVAKIIRVVLGIFGLAAFIIVLYGGYIYMTSEGSEQEISTAKKIIINGLIGMAVVLSAFSITQFLINKLAKATNFQAIDANTSGCSDPDYVIEHPECLTNTLPAVSDLGRSPYNGQEVEGEFAFSWDPWNDVDGDPVEYFVKWYPNSKLCAGASRNSGWISATTWDPTNSLRVCNEGADSWQLSAKDGIDFTTDNSCYSIEPVVCPTCTDGIQNGTETSIDCGGSTCNACPTCTDGIANGDETGVDCGGSCSVCIILPVVAFTATSATGVESVTGVNVTLSSSFVSTDDVTVNYTLSGTATSGSDYTLVNGIATIPAGSTSINIPLGIISDTADEVDETIILKITGPTNATLGANTTYTYTITDDDAPPVVVLAVSTDSGSESVTGLNVAVSIPAVSGKNVTVNFVVSGTATGGGVDYSRNNATVTIPAGSTLVNIPVIIINDTLIEANETIILTISNPINATLGANTIYTYTILDNDIPPTVAFAVTTVAVAESTPPINVSVVLSYITNQNVTVNYAVSGTATGGGVDHNRANGTASIPAGSTSVNIPVGIINDTLNESNETIILTLSNPVNATLGANIVYTFTIVDNDGLPKVSFPTSMSSGAESIATTNVVLSLSTASSNNVTVNYAVSGSAIGGGVDYTLANGTATIPAGSTSVNISVAITNDTMDESNETVILTISNPVNATLGTNTTHGYVIIDNDVSPIIAFATTVATGAESATSVNVAVVLSAVSGINTSVGYAVSGSAAGGGVDHNRGNGTAIIPAGSTSVNVPITIVDDVAYETNETIILTLSGPTNSILGTNTVYTYTITDNDTPPAIAFSATVATGAESVVTVNATVSIPAASGYVASVNYVVSGTAAGGGVDHNRANGTATIPIGSTAVNIPITIVNDLLNESNETIILTLSNPVNAVLGANITYTYTITDNDGPPTVAFTAVSASGSESVTAVNATVAISKVSGNNVSVNYTVSGGTAVGGGSDYTLANGTVTIPTGSTTITIPITIINDTSYELNETIILTLSGPTNATLGTNTTYTYTIANNDTPPAIAFSATATTGAESVTAVNVVVSIPSASSYSTSVNYAISGTAAGGGVDHNRTNGIATIPIGSTSVNISITITNDTTYEPSETIILTLSNPVNAVLGTNTVHTYTITDNDVPPTIAFTAVATSGVESVTPVNVAVSLPAVSGINATVNYTISGGTAIGGGVDFTRTDGTVTINAGSTSVNIPITITNDLLNELSETIILTLSNPVNAVLGANTTHTYTITDNDGPPTVAFATTATSGAESVTAVNIVVSTSNVSGANVTVNYTVSGTANGGGTDYTLANGTATIPTGSTSVNIPLVVNNDVVDEINETVILTLSGPVNATLGANTVHTYTIIDDENPPTIAFSATTATDLESVTSVNATISLSSSSGNNATVNFSVSGTATGGGVDHTRANGTASIPAGSTSVNIPITIVDDALDEPSETIILTLSGPTNAVLGANTTYTYTIVDNDDPDSVPFVVGSGALMLMDNANNNIYLATGDNSIDFYRYSTTAYTWTALPDVPAFVNFDTRMVFSSTNGNIYLAAGNSTAFHRYSTITSTWLQVANIPYIIGSNSQMIVDIANDNVYLADGVNFYRYSMLGNTWTTLSNIPGNISSGGQMILDNANNIYVVAGNGNAFYRYSIGSSSWTTLPVVPEIVGNSGAQAVFNGANNNMYLVLGYGISPYVSFYRYSVAGNNWISLPDVPAGIAYGTQMILDNTNNNLYLARGYGSPDFFKFTISTGNWTVLSSVPANVYVGSQMVYDIGNGSFYLTSGWGTTGFYRYYISSNTW